MSSNDWAARFYNALSYRTIPMKCDIIKNPSRKMLRQMKRACCLLDHISNYQVHTAIALVLERQVESHSKDYEEEAIPELTGLAALVYEFSRNIDMRTQPWFEHWSLLLCQFFRTPLNAHDQCHALLLLLEGLADRSPFHSGLIATKWYQMGESVSSWSQMVWIIYSLEMYLPMDWKSDRLQWQQGLHGLMMEDSSELRAMIRGFYGLQEDEIGHGLEGHKCVSEEDKKKAEVSGSALLFGELLVSGTMRVFDLQHLDADTAKIVVDLGMGLGKLLIQLYLQHVGIKKLVGIELSSSRYEKGRNALKHMSFRIDDKDTAIKAVDKQDRVIEFYEGDLFTCHETFDADIVVLETHFPKTSWMKLCTFISNMKSGSRLLTYENIEDCFCSTEIKFPFEQIEINKHPEDRFYTTWSIKRGHHFYLWKRL